MSDFCLENGVYACIGKRVVGYVGLDGEIWRTKVLVDGRIVDQGEWDGLSTALRNTRTAMVRACWLRRFEKDAPVMPGGDEDEEDDDDDD
jgi:hypothetical protein